MESGYAANVREQRRIEAEKRGDVYQHWNGDASSSHIEPGMRARRVPDGPVRRNYHNAVGRMGEMDDESNSPGSEGFNGRSRSHHDRMQIRIRLKQKGKIPGHVKWMKWMNSESKNHTVAVIAEFIGTTTFLFFAFGGTVTANIGAGSTANDTTTGSSTGFNPATLLYIAFSFGFSLMVNAWIFFRISGGLFNPAVTLALTITGDVAPIRAVLLVMSQLSGSCFAAYLVSVMFPSPFNVQTTLGDGTTVAQGVFIEAICTAELVFTIIMLAKEKHRATHVAPVGIGLALFIAELVAVYYTGGSLNPARSFGPAAVAHDFAANHWIYWVGPLIGTLLAVGFYQVMKVLEYEMANPGQDGDPENDPTQNPEHEIAQAVDDRAAEMEEIQAVEEEGGFDQLSVADLQSIRDFEAAQEGVHRDSTEEWRDIEAQRRYTP